MRSRHSRTLAVALAVAAGGLAAFALRPAASTSTATLAARNPAVEVRTQVIRRTIHVIRHEPGAGLRGPRASSPIVVSGRGHGHARTGASGAHRSSAAANGAAVATRASGGHGAAAGHVTGTGAPVGTRTSGSRGSSAPARAGRSVSTRTSGSHSGSSAGSSVRPVTGSSGAGHKGGDDGGDGHGGGGDN